MTDRYEGAPPARPGLPGEPGQTLATGFGIPPTDKIVGEPGLVFCIQPDYGGGNSCSHRMFWTGSLRPGSPHRLFQDRNAASFIVGNVLFSSALNAQEFDDVPVTHVAMMHNDIVPEYGWLSILLDELARVQLIGDPARGIPPDPEAAMMSAVVPIKDLEGKSSVAIDNPDNPFEVERRITMKEIGRLPETFCIDDVGYPDRCLLANHGCWVMDFTKPWRKAVDSKGRLKIAFSCDDQVVRLPNGRWQTQHDPADWRFSRSLAKLGARVYCTTKLTLYHMGEMCYTNQASFWHDPDFWDTDEALKHKFGGVPLWDRPGVRLRQPEAVPTGNGVKAP